MLLCAQAFIPIRSGKSPVAKEPERKGSLWTTSKELKIYQKITYTLEKRGAFIYNVHITLKT
jgi:hypothetical protein